MNSTDVLEFIIAGSSAVQIGTANFIDPFIWPKLLKGLREYAHRKNINHLSELVGSIVTEDHEAV